MQSEQLTGRVIHKSMFIAASPERVFQAFTTREDLEKWVRARGNCETATGRLVEARLG